MNTTNELDSTFPEPTDTGPARADRLPTATITAAWIAAIATLAAAAIHFAVTPDHFGEATSHGLFMLSAGVAQVGLAVALVVRPTRGTAAFALLTNAALVAVWAVSRTVGLPFGLGTEIIGVTDSVCVAFEIGAVLVSILVLAAPRSASLTQRSFVRPALAPLAIVAAIAVGATGVALAQAAPMSMDAAMATDASGTGTGMQAMDMSTPADKSAAPNAAAANASSPTTMDMNGMDMNSTAATTGPGGACANVTGCDAHEQRDDHGTGAPGPAERRPAGRGRQAAR